jgi:hypothetical protein
MLETLNYIDLYQERLTTGDSHMPWEGIVADKVNKSLQKLGHNTQSPPKIAHGLLAFGSFPEGSPDEPDCVPWLVDPATPDKAKSIGRHQYVAQEFSRKFCTDAGFTPSNAYGSDYLGTYNVVVDGEHLAIAYHYDTYFSNPDLRAQATGKIVQISRDLGMVKFCIEQPHSVWSVIQNGQQERRRII